MLATDPLHERLARALDGRYALEHELASGGTAVVWQARELRHGRPVAIKVLRPELVAAPAEGRFAREVEIASGLNHPHIVPLLDSGDVDGLLYLVMPFIEGESLGARLRREGALPPRDVVRIVADVADALAYAHARGVVHRDIKPDNILLAGRNALVTDFGVAKALTAVSDAGRELTAGVALGTPTYMAPEQATADPAVDHRADLYALGVVAYEMLAGHPPFSGRTPQEILAAHVLDDPEPLAVARPGVPPALAALVMRALAKRPGERWADADELLAHLEPVQTPSGGTAAVTAARAWARWPVWTGMLMGLGLAVVLAMRIHVPPTVPEAGMQRRATFEGSVYESAISPDGRELAYLVSAGSGARLMLRDLRAGQSTELVRAPYLQGLSWSSDGAELRFLDQTAGSKRLRAVSRVGGPARDVSATLDGDLAELSPSGRRIAAFRQATNLVHFRDLQGGDTTSVPLGPGVNWGTWPVWSPDERYVAIATESAPVRRWMLRIADREGRAAWVVTSDTMPIGAPAWAPDGRAIYFLRRHDDLTELLRIAVDPARRRAEAAEVLVDGLETGPVDVASDQPARLSLSADGRTFSVLRRARWSNLLRVPLAGTPAMRAPEPVTMGAALVDAARLSPDGAALAWLQTDGTGTHLEVSGADGVAHEMARFPAAVTLAWAPTGRAIAVITQEPDSGQSVRVLDLDLGTNRRFAAGLAGWSVTWTPAGDLLYGTRQNREFRRIELATGRDTRFAEPPDSTGYSLEPRFSPDGRMFAWYWNLRGARGVYATEPGSGARRKLFAGLETPLRWSRDGSVLYSATLPMVGQTAAVHAFTSSRTGRELLRLGPGQRVEDVAPDGRSALVIEAGDRGDAWLLANPDAAP